MSIKSFFTHSRAAQRVFLFGLTAVAAVAQSGDITASTAPFTTLGVTILKVVMGLIVLGCVGVVAYGGVTLGANRPRGLAMIASGIVGGLVAGVSFALIGTTSGATVPTNLILVPFIG